MSEKRTKQLDARIRPDGRPEAFDVPETAPAKPCRRCLERFGKSQKFRRGNLFLMSGPSSPWRDDAPSLICFDHLPENVVISDPFSGFECRNKTGAERWQESDPNVYARENDPTPDLAGDGDILRH